MEIKRRELSVETLERVCSNALAGGYGHFLEVPYPDKHAGEARRVFQLDSWINCTRPYKYELHARWSGQHGKRKLPLTVLGENRCRKCEACMKWRSNHWMNRARAEFSQHRNTLMITLTFSPEAHFAIDARILAHLATQGVDCRALPSAELDNLRATALGRELKLFLGRIRKGNRDHPSPKFRYMAVFEKHEGGGELNGRFHIHILLHTNRLGGLVMGAPKALHPHHEWYVTKSGKVRAADKTWLRSCWSFGHSTVELASTSGACWYVCKYTTKTLARRVRASQGYGTQNTQSVDRLKIFKR